MTQENKSVLKTKLGLENLKGLGDTLKQIKEVKESLDEAQETIGELAKDNSPLGKALARLVEAQGQKVLNEDNVNVSEEVRKTMAEKLEEQGKTLEELEAENKGLKEDKVVREVSDTVRAELDKRLPQPGGNNDSGGNKLMDSLEKVVADYMEKLLLRSGGDGTLTSDQIRSVIREEVAQVTGGSKKPEDMVDDLVTALTMGDKLREKLGGVGIGGRLVQGQGGDSGLKTDLVKVLLEDERERLKISHNHEAETRRNKHLGTIAETVKENLSTGISAISAAVEEVKGTGTKKTEQEPQPQVFRCGECGVQFSSPPGWAGQPIKCPKPECGREYTKEELLA